MDINTIFNKETMMFVLTLIVVLYVISHYVESVSDMIGLDFKGTQA